MSSVQLILRVTGLSMSIPWACGSKKSEDGGKDVKSATPLPCLPSLWLRVGIRRATYALLHKTPAQTWLDQIGAALRQSLQGVMSAACVRLSVCRYATTFTFTCSAVHGICTYTRAWLKAPVQPHTFSLRQATHRPKGSNCTRNNGG